MGEGKEKRGKKDPAKVNHHLTYDLSHPIPIQALYSRCTPYGVVILVLTFSDTC